MRKIFDLRTAVVCLVLLGTLTAAACQTRTDNVLSTSKPADNRFYTGLNEQDIRLAERNRQIALESLLSRTSSSWRNRTTGNKGRITPARTFKTIDGQYCRQFEERLSGASGKSRMRTGLACRTNGQWVEVYAQ